MWNTRLSVIGALLFFTQTLFAANVLVEDFSSIPINPILLGAVDGQISGGQYRMAVTQIGNGRTTERVRINQQGVVYLSAKVTLSSTSNTAGAPTPRIRGRITHYLGNVNFNAGNPLINGAEGNIWTQLTIEKRSDGTFRAIAHAERVTDSLFTTGNDVFYQNLSPIVPAVSYNQQFELAIEIIGSTVNYFIDGTLKFTFDLTDNGTYPELTGNIYPVTNFPAGLALPQLQARVQNGPGTAVVLFDDITTRVLLPTVNSIPTLSQWGLFILMSLLLVASGLRRQKISKFKAKKEI